MRWPWQPPTEDRQAVGGYTQIISALISAQAAGTTQQASATAATEAVAGALSRAFADARVDGPADVAEALSPRTLAQIGRDLVRVGESLHVIRIHAADGSGLLPASTWYWQGGADPADWLCTATVYGPSGSSTWRLPQSSVIFTTWGSTDRTTLPRAITFKLGGRYDAAHGKHRAIPGKRNKRAGCPTVAGPTGRRRRRRGRRGPA